jgi:hypothetical protein
MITPLRYYLDYDYPCTGLPGLWLPLYRTTRTMITPVQDYLDYENSWALCALDYDNSCTVLPGLWHSCIVLPGLRLTLYRTTWTMRTHGPWAPWPLPPLACWWPPSQWVSSVRQELELQYGEIGVLLKRIFAVSLGGKKTIFCKINFWKLKKTPQKVGTFSEYPIITEDLSNDSTLDPSQFSRESPFNLSFPNFTICRVNGFFPNDQNLLIKNYLLRLRSVDKTAHIC